MREIRSQLKILRWIVYPVDAIIMLLIALQLLQFTGIQQRVILSNSMVPYLAVNDLVFVKECNIGEAKEGDVACFTVGQNVVCHRIISMNGDGTITTKGDAVDQPDTQLTTQDEFIGTVSLKLPKGGIIYQFEQSLFFKIIVVLFVLLTIFI